MQETTSPLAVAIDRVLDESYTRGTVLTQDGEARDIHPTGMRLEQGQRIAEIVAQEGAKRSFETGFAYGLSTLRIVRSIVENGAEIGAGPIHVAFDPFQSTLWGSAGSRLCEAAGIEDLVHLREEDSQIALPGMVASGEQFDFALIDGNHIFEFAFTDVMYALKLVKPGGLVLVDDTWLPSVRTVVDFFVQNLGVEIDPEASQGADDWRGRRSRFRRKRRRTRSGMIGLRVPEHPDGRAWDHFEAFGDGR